MDFGHLWNTIIVLPLESGLRALADFTGSGGLAIILFTILVRLVLLPLGIQGARSQKAMLALQPELKELQRKYKNDRERLMQEQQRLYRERGVNPLAGCLPLVLQMPIFIGLYSALFNLATHAPEFAQRFLWLCSLAQPDYVHTSCDPLTPLTVAGFTVPGPLPILTAITTFVVQRMSTMPSDDPQQQMMNQMMLFMPLVFIFVTFTLPAGLVLYWVTTNLFSIVQQYFTTGWGSLLPARPAGANGGPSAPPSDAADAGPSATTPPPASRPADQHGPTGSRPALRAAKRRKSGKR